MTTEEFERYLDKVMQKYGGTVEHIPSKPESEGTQKVQFLTVKYPTSPSESSDTQAEDKKPPRPDQPPEKE
jgi:hypothetical protein